MNKNYKVGDRVQMKDSPQFYGKILWISSTGMAQLDRNLCIHVDNLELKKRQKRGPAMAKWCDQTSAMPDSNGKFFKVK